MADTWAELLDAVRAHVGADECGCSTLAAALDAVDRESGRIFCAADRDNRRYTVRLDGVVCPYVYRACPTEGWVQRYVVGKDGRPIVREDGLRMETVRGVVTVVDPG